MGKTTDPAPLRSEVNDAVLSTVRGGLRALGGIVQVAAGVTRLLVDTAIKVVEAAEGAVMPTGGDEEDQKP
jgi:hypothetical protein